MTPEWSRPERVDGIGERPRDIAIAADAAERAGLASRFALVAIDRLDGAFQVRRDGGGVLVTGRVSASLTQACSITDEPLRVEIDEPVTLRFVAEGDAAEDVELTEDALDTLPIEDGAIDLGEAAAETMALALDPFPRSPDATAALREAGVIGEDEVTPFNAFSALGDRLRRG